MQEKWGGPFQNKIRPPLQSSTFQMQGGGLWRAKKVFWPTIKGKYFKTDIFTDRFIVLEWLGQLAHREYRWQLQGARDIFQYLAE